MNKNVKVLFLIQGVIVSVKVILLDSGPTDTIHNTEQKFSYSKTNVPHLQNINLIHVCGYCTSHTQKWDIHSFLKIYLN